jgi:hypothetical protein
MVRGLVLSESIPEANIFKSGQLVLSVGRDSQPSAKPGSLSIEAYYPSGLLEVVY